jgi:hypothetical protein
MTSLTKIGKRLDNIVRYVLDNHPQDKWILSNIVPLFLEAIKSSTSIQEEQLIIVQLNKLLDNFEFRYNQIFEYKNKQAQQINQNLTNLIEKIKKDFNIQEEKVKRDRCLRIADRKFDKPSAYKSGAVVRCRAGKIWKDIKEESIPLNEYSDKLINKLIDKWKAEDNSLEIDNIKAYIERFTQIKDSYRVTKKDITQYTWKELESLVDSNQPKRIKAGKINDGEPKDANLVYNQNGLRIYVGKTKQACIKYGNGYNFCISSRGGDNLYHDYRYEQHGTPYFIFDDTKTSEQDKKGEFTDPEHVLVLFVYPHEEYSITTADNPGERNYEYFRPIEQIYPRLKGLKDIFKRIELDPKEKAELDIQKNYNDIINNISDEYTKPFQDNYTFKSIEGANKYIDDILENNVEIYRFTGKLKSTANQLDYDYSKVSQYRFVKNKNIKEQYKDFIENIIIPAYNPIQDKLKSPEDSVNDWDITYEKQDDIDKLYFKKIKNIIDQYRNELSKLRLIREKTKETLRTWFKRKGAPGKTGGWVDCNAPIRKDGKITGYKPCGRQKGEKRAYPACRPTPAGCKAKGKGTKWGKTK